MGKTIINAQIDSSLKAEAVKLAARLDIPLSTVISAVLRKFIADRGVEIKEYIIDDSNEFSSSTDEELDIPSTEEYKAAFRKLSDKGALKSWMVKMLVVQFHSPNHRASSLELAEKLNYKGFNAINRWYGEIGKVVSQEMKFSYGNHIPASVLSDFARENVAGSKTPQWILTMRPEVAQALKELKIV